MKVFQTTVHIYVLTLLRDKTETHNGLDSQRIQKDIDIKLVLHFYLKISIFCLLSQNYQHFLKKINKIK